MSVDQISDTLGISARKVKSRLHYAREAMRRVMVGEAEGRPRSEDYCGFNPDAPSRSTTVRRGRRGGQERHGNGDSTKCGDFAEDEMVVHRVAYVSVGSVDLRGVFGRFQAKHRGDAGGVVYQHGRIGWGGCDQSGVPPHGGAAEPRDEAEGAGIEYRGGARGGAGAEAVKI